MWILIGILVGIVGAFLGMWVWLVREFRKWW